MTEDGSFYVGVPQIAERFQFLIHNASRDLKALLGKDIQFLKLKTKLHPKAINAISIDLFEKLLFELALKGNKEAIAFSRMLIGLSLRQLFSDAFKVKFEEEERQEWLKERWHHRTHFHPYLTKWLKEDADSDSSTVNWGKEINLFKVACSLPLTCVDNWDSQQLQTLNHAETSYNALRMAGLEHDKAMGVVKQQHKEGATL